MSAILPINLDHLLYGRGVESERVEFKGSWDPETTGPQVLRTTRDRTVLPPAAPDQVDIGFVSVPKRSTPSNGAACFENS